MIPVLYEANETSFNTLGLGFLPAWIEDTCEVHETKNDEFFLQGELPVGALHVDQIAEDRIIMAAPAPSKPMQPFRIKRIQKPAGSDKVQLLAPHVSYQLTENVVKSNVFATASAQEAMRHLFGGGAMVPPIDESLWAFESDITLSKAVQTTHLKPVSARAAIGGVEGSLIDLYGGELEWDRWTVRLMSARGRDTGKYVRYGVNMRDLSFDTDMSGLVTCYYGWWRDTNGLFYTDARYDKPNIGDFAYPRVEIVDLSGKVEYDEETQSRPTAAQMLAALKAYADARNDNRVRTGIVVEPAQEELQDVYLCDYVTAVHPVYDLLQKTQLVGTVFDPVKEKYKELTIGEIQKDITSTIAALLKR